MRRIGLVVVLAFCLPALVAEAQETARVSRVGLLSIGSDPNQPLTWRPFLEGMQELGYVEGRNLTVQRALGGGRAADLPGLVQELVRSGVDVIVTTGTRETVAAKQAAPTTPIVMLLVPDPVGQGLARTLARPGGTVTGLTNLVPGLVQNTSSCCGKRCLRRPASQWSRIRQTRYPRIAESWRRRRRPSELLSRSFPSMDRTTSTKP